MSFERLTDPFDALIDQVRASKADNKEKPEKTGKDIAVEVVPTGKTEGEAGNKIEKKKAKVSDSENIFETVTKEEKSWISGKASQIYGKLSDAGKQAFDLAYDKTQTSFLGRIKVWKENKLEDFVERFASKRNKELKEYEGEIINSQKNLEKLEGILSNPKASEKVKTKAQKEITIIKDNISHLTSGKERIQSQLERENRIKMAYEDRRKGIAEHMMGIIKDRMSPHEAKFESLQNKKDILDSEIVLFGEKIKNFELQASELEREIENSELKAEKAMLREQLKELREVLKESRAHLKKRIDQRPAIEMKAAERKRKIDEWSDLRGEYIRAIQRRTPQYGVGRKEVPEEDSVESEKPETAKVVETAEKPEISSETRSKTRSEGPEYTIDEYIGNWNKFFASRFEIRSKSLASYLETLPEGKIAEAKELAKGKRVTAEVFEETIRSYYGWMKENGTNRPQLSEKELNKIFKTVKVFLELK